MPISNTRPGLLPLIFALLHGSAVMAAGSTDQQQRQRSLDSAAFVDRGACPFECCEYTNWIANREIAVHQAMDEASPVVFRIEKGEWVKGLTGVVITTRPGQARVSRPVALGGRWAREGDLVELLTYGGEGVYKLRYRGTVIEPDLDQEEFLTIVTAPESVWWVKLKNTQGSTGWSKESDAFGNQDRCE